MNPTQPSRDPLAMLLAGGLDRLLPREVDALEHRLNTREQEAHQAASIRGLASDVLHAPSPMPARAEWDRVWSAIEEQAGAAAPAPKSLRIPRWLRPASALAACVGLALTLTPLSGPIASPARAAAATVEILNLDVSANTVSAVDFADASGGPVIISFYEDVEDDQGA